MCNVTTCNVAHVARCLLHVAQCILPVVRCTLYIACCAPSTNGRTQICSCHRSQGSSASLPARVMWRCARPEPLQRSVRYTYRGRSAVEPTDAVETQRVRAVSAVSQLSYHHRQAARAGRLRRVSTQRGRDKRQGDRQHDRELVRDDLPSVLAAHIQRLAQQVCAQHRSIGCSGAGVCLRKRARLPPHVCILCAAERDRQGQLPATISIARGCRIAVSGKQHGQPCVDRLHGPQRLLQHVLP